MTKNKKSAERGRGRPATYKMKPREECIETLWKVYREEGEIAQTIRHYYYGLKRLHMFELNPDEPNSGENAYKGVVRLLSYARKNKFFPYYAVIDTSRRSLGQFTGSESIQSYISTLGYSGYTLDPWRGQPRRVEVFTEKDGMANFLSNAVYEWRIPVYVNKGYGSISMLREAAIRYQDGSKWLLLYVGDFDPSGFDIQRALLNEINSHGGKPLVERVALVQADLATLDPLEQLPINPKDPRKRAFEEEYGRDHPCYQMESMPAGVLRAKIQQVVRSHIDEDEFRAALALEDEIKQRAKRALKQSVDTFAEEIKASGYLASHSIYLTSPRKRIPEYIVRGEDDDIEIQEFPHREEPEEDITIAEEPEAQEALEKDIPDVIEEEAPETLEEDIPNEVQELPQEAKELIFCVPARNEGETQGLLVLEEDFDETWGWEKEYEMKKRYDAYREDKWGHMEWLEWENHEFIFRPPEGYKPDYAFSEVFPIPVFCVPADKSKDETQGFLAMPSEWDDRWNKKKTDEMEARYEAYQRDYRQHPEWEHYERDPYRWDGRLVWRPPAGYRPAYAFSEVFPEKSE